MAAGPRQPCRLRAAGQRFAVDQPHPARAGGTQLQALAVGWDVRVERQDAAVDWRDDPVSRFSTGRRRTETAGSHFLVF